MKLEKTKDIGLPAGVLGLAASPDGTNLFAACMDGAVYACDPATGSVTPLATRHSSFASGCVLLPGGETVLSAGYDGWLHWHDVESRQCFRRVQAHSFWSWQLALSADGDRAASVTGQFLAGGEKYEPAPATEPTLKVFDTQTGELVQSFAHGPPVLSTAFSPDGRHIAAANMMGEVGIWEIASGKQAVLFKSPGFTSWGINKSPHYCGGIYGLAFTRDAAALICCGMGPMFDPMAGNGRMTWERWDWRASPARKQDQIRDGDRGAGLMEALAQAPDYSAFVMGGRQVQGTWNAALFGADGKLLASLDTKSRVTRAVFTQGGRTLFLAAAVGQPPRKNGKWADFGRIHVVKVVSERG